MLNQKDENYKEELFFKKGYYQFSAFKTVPYANNNGIIINNSLVQIDVINTDDRNDFYDDDDDDFYDDEVIDSHGTIGLSKEEVIKLKEYLEKILEYENVQ